MTKRKHKFAGEDEASNLVSWLNSGESDGHRRIAEIVEIYNKLGKSSPQIWRPGEKKTGPKWALSVERGAMSRRLQGLIDRYHYKFQWFGGRTILAPTRKLTGDAFHEFHCMPHIHLLRKMNLLPRVKHCDGCTKWMFARLPEQRFCSESCRIKAYQSTKDWRDRNNAKRRELYHLRKQNGKIRYQERRGAL